jgi:Flp pilus assembly protein TadG
MFRALSRHTLPRVRRRRRRRGEHGQALVEFAVFFLLITLLIVGAVDVSGLLNDHVNIEYAARQGARTGAVMGSQAQADCAIVGAISAALVNMPNLTLTRITIYKAGPDGLPVGADAEEIYPGNTQCQVINGTPTLSQSPTVDTWSPSQRSNQPFYEDSLGVELDYSYTFVFRFPPFDSVIAGSDRTVMPINPVAIPSPIPTP